MDHLDTYLKATGIRRIDFARSVGISAPYLSQILGGLKRPSLALAIRIERATQGTVPAHVWVSHQGQPSPSSPSRSGLPE